MHLAGTRNGMRGPYDPSFLRGRIAGRCRESPVMQAVGPVRLVLRIPPVLVDEVGITAPVPLPACHLLHRIHHPVLDELDLPVFRIGIPHRCDELALQVFFPFEFHALGPVIDLVPVIYPHLKGFRLAGETGDFVGKRCSADLIDGISVRSTVHADIGVPPGTADRTEDMLPDGSATLADIVLVDIGLRIMGVPDQDLGTLEGREGGKHIVVVPSVIDVSSSCLRTLPERRVGAEHHQLILLAVHESEVLLQPFHLLVGEPRHVQAVVPSDEQMFSYLEMFKPLMYNPLCVVLICIGAPLTEELVFRGAIQGHLMKWIKNPWVSIVLASILFGLAHGNLPQFIAGFIMGMVCGWLFYRTGSIWPGIALHFFNNTFSTVSTWIWGMEESDVTANILPNLILPILGIVLIYVAYKKLVPVTEESVIRNDALCDKSIPEDMKEEIIL